MKDNRTSPFLSDFSGATKTLSGSLFLSASSYVRFNDFLDSDNETGTRLLDFASNNQYTVQSGSFSGLGTFALATGSLVDLNIYGQKIYTDLEVRPGYKVRALAAQRGFRLPIVPAPDGSAHDPIFIGRDLNDIWPTSPPSGWSGLTFMLKFVVRGDTNNPGKSLITVAEGPDSAALGAFNVAFTNTGNLVINHKKASAGIDASVQFVKNTVWQVGQFLTLLVHVDAAATNPQINRAMLFDTATGELLGERSHTATGATMVSLSNPKLYVGYGDLDGAANYSFPLDSFLKNVDIAEIAIFGPLTGEQMELVARSNLAEVGYKSGFNNRPVSRTQQLLDARTAYPPSANPAIGQADPLYTKTPAFNDEDTKFFGTGSALQAQQVMFPEMLPAHMFSGSSADRGAVGDVKPFYRDAHHTDYDKRLVARGALRQGLSHKETEILNVATRNSPIIIGEDADALGGNVSPFNDNHPLADQNTSPAVSVDTYPGLQQRLGDHVAIVIELNPAESTTVGVERTGGAEPWLGTPTGRVTSMAYFNFATKKWETAGERGDFFIPGAIEHTTGSRSNSVSDKVNTVVGQGFERLFKQSSVGFSGTSGFTIYQNEGSNAFAPLSQRGTPTSNYGFPIHPKYQAKDEQLIDMSDYIDAPFVLEKVSLEFGAAIEESGPHSLGYKITTFKDSDVVGGSSSPAVRFYSARGIPGGGGTAGGAETYTDMLQKHSILLNRGEFINGSLAADLWDFRHSDVYTHVVADAAGALDGDGNKDTFGLPQSRNVAAIMLANQNHSRFNETQNPQIAGADLPITPPPESTPVYGLRGPGIYFTAPERDPYSGLSKAQVFLPTVVGPRTIGSTTGAQLRSERVIEAPGGNDCLSESGLPSTGERSYAINYIPIIAGGVNGVVTGAIELAQTGAGGPWLALESIPYATQEDASSDTLSYMGPDQADFETVDSNGFSSAGGVPFWRADTFFLLRQTQKSPGIGSQVEYSFRITAGSSKSCFPLAPYAGMDQTQDPQFSSPPGTFMIDDFTPSAEDQLQRFNGVQSAGARKSGISGSILLTDIGSPTYTVNWFNAVDTSRELIGFGQMVHYGYAAAQTSYMDTIWSHEDRSLFSQSSGSMNTDFMNQLFTQSSPGVFDGERQVPLFGQAIKIARNLTPKSTLIPGNVDSLNTIVPESVAPVLRTKSSAFSDFPDTNQGQYSQQAGEQDPSKYTTDKPLTIFTKADFAAGAGGGASLTKRNAAGPARYAREGGQPQASDWTASGFREFPGTHFEHAHSLDTYQAYPLLQHDRGDSIGTHCIISGSRRSGPKNLSSDGEDRTFQHNSPAGSGFSLITTPAWPVRGPRHSEYSEIKIASDEHGVGGSQFPKPYIFPRPLFFNDATLASSQPAGLTPLYRYWDDVNFGTFDTAPPATSDAAVNKRSTSVLPGSALGDSPTKSWLDSGLKKELMIEIGEGHKHEGMNIDVQDNWSGFTLMTASTIWRPYESPGRETAALPLHANVYKRQWLNYMKQTKIEFNVKRVNPTSIEDSGYWCITSQEMFGPQMIAYPPSLGGPTSYADLEAAGELDYPPLLIPETTNIHQYINTGSADRAVGAKRFHRRWTATVADGGFAPGVRADSLSSGRAFIRAAGASTKLDSRVNKPPFVGSGPAYASNDGDATTAQTAGLTPTEESVNRERSFATGSIAAEPVQDSLYVLQPGDKLILGLQPSLPGWNAGSGLPNNRWAKKYGVWDYDSIDPVNDSAAPQHDVDERGQVITGDDCKMNLEDPYEPCHGLTMLQGKSRLVLYGTFLRDNKYYSPSSKQQLRSAAVHEALHYDNPVLDQYLTSNRDEYVGSYLEQHVTGTIEGTTDPRSVAGTATRGDLVFSGSFQRFTRAADTSQVFYDTLPQNPLQICSVDGFISAGNPSLARVFNIHHASPKIASASAAYYDAASGILDYPYALNGYWTDSFPFEQKYAGVDRMVERNVKFLTPLGLEKAFIGMGAGLDLIGAGSPITADNGDGQSPGEASKLPGGSLAGIDKIGKDDLETAIDGHANFLPSVNLMGIRNMSNVFVPAESADISLLSQNFPTSPNIENASKLFRMFFANMIGYGRKNRKKLDISHDRWYFQSGSVPFVGESSTGRVIGLHPAGFKFGYMNCDHLSPSAVHRGDRYGQFRDMLEQRLYSKVYSYGDEFTKRGESESAVSAIFVDADGAPIDDATKTQCLNLSTAMTASKPYIEGEVLREIIFSSESVTIE